MRKPETITIGDRAYNWKQLCELRAKQLEEWRAAKGRQLALFELKDDSRPKAERTASGRYTEPTLLSLLAERIKSPSA